jgi:hypothetical protein
VGNIDLFHNEQLTHRVDYSAIEWSGFIVLDIGLDVVDGNVCPPLSSPPQLTSFTAIPRGQRVLAGLFQSLGVRASGFSIVSIGALAPACR